MPAKPFLKFYPADWRSDPRLRMCSLAARGLWIECIAIMHEAGGYLKVGDVIPTEGQIAALIGASQHEVAGLIAELEQAGVFSRTRTGVIYSRKMVRATKISDKGRENGKKGGNPSLCNPKEKSQGVNPQSNTYILETRDYILDSTLPPPPSKDDRASETLEGAAGGGGGSRTLREDILDALGLDHTGLTGHGGNLVGTTADMAEVARWQSDLGLTHPQIVAIVREVMATRGQGPPARLKYFTPAMQRAAAALKAGTLAPAALPTGKTAEVYDLNAAFQRIFGDKS